MKKQLISIVIPAYNEEHSIQKIYHSLTQVMKTLSGSYEYEIIFVDDGSNDGTWNAIETIAKKDKKVKGICFSKNFWKEIALTAWIFRASWDAVITIDCDGQHPVDKIPLFIEKWKEGYDIVYNKRPQIQGASFIKKISSSLFYTLFNAISEFKLEPHTTDYRILDRNVINAFLQFKEKNRMFRGIIDSLGFSKTYLVFDALPNNERTPRYTYKKLYNLAINALTSFSIFPLKFIGYLGVFITIIGIVTMGIMILDKLWVVHLWFTNLAFVVVSNTILIGIELISLWLIALYIAKIHSEVIEKPLYIEKKTINL